MAIFRSPSFGLDIIWDGNCHEPHDDDVFFCFFLFLCFFIQTENPRV